MMRFASDAVRLLLGTKRIRSRMPATFQGQVCGSAHDSRTSCVGDRESDDRDLKGDAVDQGKVFNLFFRESDVQLAA